MRVIGALLLTLSVVTPASSVFVIVPGILQQAGSGAFLALALGAVIGFAMALVYAELSSAFPIAGAEYSILARAIGPLSGFMIMGVTAVNTTMGMATLAVGAAPYLSAIQDGLDPVAVGVTTTLIATLFSILNIRANAWITGLFLATEVLALLVLAALGFTHEARPLSEIALHPVRAAEGGLVPLDLSALALGVTVAAFAYNGFGAAVSFAEEMHEAPRLVARTVLYAFAATVALELVPVTAVLLGAQDLLSLVTSANPFETFVGARIGEAWGAFFNLFIFLAIANAVLATILINARFLYSTGRDHVWWPAANRALETIHPRTNAPWIATLVAGGAAAAACFIPLPLLLVLSGTGIVVTYGFLCLAVLIGRRSGTTAHAPYRMPGHPVVAVFGLIAVALIAVDNWADPDVGRPSLIVVLTNMAVCALYYRLVLARSGRWTLRGPADEI